jgi:anti-sigma regulatory factor (Ser/Thr protein kinase)
MEVWSIEPLATGRTLACRGDRGSDVLSCDADVAGDANRRYTTTVGSMAGLRAMRRRVAEWLHELGIEPPLFIADVQLAAVEVVTNAFVHSSAETVDVSLEIVDDDVVATIEHRSPIPTPIHAPTELPSDASATGRGLFVVDQIARARTVLHTGTASTIRLDIPLPAQA